MALGASRTEPTLIGRAEVLAEARKYFREPVVKRAPVLWLLGATGVGKSTFIQELVREERERGTLVMEGRALPMELPQPYFVLQEALRSLPKVRRQAEKADRGASAVGVAGLGILRPSGNQGRSLVPLGLLPFESGNESAEGRESRLLDALSGDETSVEEGRMELFDGLASHLEDVSAESPLLLVLEDLHHADEGSLEFLSFLARRGREVSLRVLASSLPEAELPGRVRVHEEALAKEGLLRKISLRSLTEAEASEFVHLLSHGRKVSETQVTKWHTLTEGNPLFLEQLVRGELLPAAGEEAKAREGPSPELPRGEELRVVLRRRFREMSEEERRALSYASVLGKEFSFSLLHRSSGEEEEKLAEAIESLVRRGLLREKGGEHFEFVHEELRGEVYMSLTEVRRGILHRKVAETLEKDLPKEGAPEPHLIYELARHWYIAQVDDKALEYNRRAAELAKQALSPRSAADHLERALEAHRRLRPHDKPGEVALALELALMLDAVGEVPAAAKLLEELIAQSHRAKEAYPARDRVRLAVHVAKILGHAGEMRRAAPLLREALELLGPEGDPALLGHAHRLLGTTMYYQGDYAPAEAEYVQAQGFFERAHAPVDVARTKVSLANVRSMVHQEIPVAQVEALYREAIAELVARGEISEAASAGHNLALFYHERGTLDQAIHQMEESLRLAERASNPRMIGWCEFNMAGFRLQKGDLDAVQELNQRARDQLTRVGDKIALIQVTLNDGRLFLARNDLSHAELSFLDAYRQAREVALEPDELEVLLRLAELSLRREDHPAAVQKVEEMEQRSFRTVRPDLVRELDALRTALTNLGVKVPPAHLHAPKRSPHHAEGTTEIPST